MKSGAFHDDGTTQHLHHAQLTTDSSPLQYHSSQAHNQTRHSIMLHDQAALYFSSRASIPAAVKAERIICAGSSAAECLSKTQNNGGGGGGGHRQRRPSDSNVRQQQQSRQLPSKHSQTCIDKNDGRKEMQLDGILGNSDRADHKGWFEEPPNRDNVDGGVGPEEDRDSSGPEFAAIANKSDGSEELTWVSWESVGLPDLSNLCERHCRGGEVLVDIGSTGGRVLRHRSSLGDMIIPQDGDALYPDLSVVEDLTEGETTSDLPRVTDRGEGDEASHADADHHQLPSRDFAKAPHYSVAGTPVHSHRRHQPQPPLSGGIHSDVVTSGAASVVSGMTLDTCFNIVASSAVHPNRSPGNCDDGGGCSNSGNFRREQKDPPPSMSTCTGGEDPPPSLAPSLMEHCGHSNGNSEKEGIRFSARRSQRRGDRHTRRSSVKLSNGGSKEVSKPTVSEDKVRTDAEPGYTEASHDEELALLRYFEEQKRNSASKSRATAAAAATSSKAERSLEGRRTTSAGNPREQHAIFQQDYESIRSSRSRENSSVNHQGRGGGSGRVDSTKASTASTQVEIAPGEFRTLRGSREIDGAIKAGYFVNVSCLSCGASLATIRNAEMIICPGCSVVSPTLPSHGGEIADDVSSRGGSSRRRHRMSADIGSKQECWGVAMGVRSDDIFDIDKGNRM